MNTVKIKSHEAFRGFVAWCHHNPDLVNMFYVTCGNEWDQKELAAVVILSDADAVYCSIAFGVTVQDHDPVEEFWYQPLYDIDNNFIKYE